MDKTQKKVLIFGVGGFVGSYLAKEFAEHGYLVYGSDVMEDCSVVELIGYQQADLLSEQAVQDVLKAVGPDMIVNLAAISSVGLSWSIPQKTMSVNVIGVLNIMEAARQFQPMPKVMFIGSSEEYAERDVPINEQVPLDANNPYGISKLAQEKFAEVYRARYGMKIYCVRPFNHTGIGQKDTFVIPSFCRQAAEIERSGKDGVIKVGNLQAYRDFSNVKDIVRAYRKIIESENCDQVYNVGSGEAHSLQEMLEYIVSLSSQKIEVQVDPARFRPVDTPVICCDNRKIRCELGWEPEYDIFETLKVMFEYYRDMQCE